jgi:hypothetical protein
MSEKRLGIPHAAYLRTRGQSCETAPSRIGIVKGRSSGLRCRSPGPAESQTPRRTSLPVLFGHIHLTRSQATSHFGVSRALRCTFHEYSTLLLSADMAFALVYLLAHAW